MHDTLREEITLVICNGKISFVRINSEYFKHGRFNEGRLL